MRLFERQAGQQPDPAPMGTPRRRRVKASDLGLSTSRYINMIPHIITVVTFIHFHKIYNYFILRAYHLILLFIFIFMPLKSKHPKHYVGKIIEPETDDEDDELNVSFYQQSRKMPGKFFGLAHSSRNPEMYYIN